MILAEAALACACFPAVITLRNLATFTSPARASQWQAISVVVPARNEEDNIGPACAGILASEDLDIELVVVNDHSTDRTAEVLGAIKDERLRVITPPSLPPGWTGKQHACASGAALATHDIMVFVDADVRLAPDALSRVAGFMQREDVGLGSGFPRELCTGLADGLLLPLIHFLLLGFLPMRLMRRRVSPALGAGCGQLIAVRQNAYQQAGGHAAIAQSMHDGIMLPRAFRRAGIMTGIFDASHFAKCQMYADGATLLEGLLKNATEGMARPVALPIWTLLLGVGQIIPLVLLLSTPNWLYGIAFLATIAVRALLAIRFKAPFWSVIFHPISIVLFLGIQWFALIRQLRGRPSTWRGRAYAP